MMNEKEIRAFQKKVYIVGVALILLFTSILLYIKFSRDYSESHTTVSIVDSRTSEKIQGFYNIKDYLNYLENAMENDNVDRFLRGCAIEEKVDNYPFSYCMKQSDLFSYSVSYLPSATYDEYQPLNQLIFSRDFLNQYNTLRQQLKEKSGNDDNNFEIVKAGILKSEDQMEESYLNDIKKRADHWKADYFVDMTALIKSGDKYYSFCFTLGRYDQCYKLFNLQSDLVDWDSDLFVKEKTEKEFDELCSDVDPDEFSANLEKKVVSNIPTETKENEQIDDITKVTLPVNYSIIRQKCCNTPKACISNFLTEMARHNPSKALNYCYAYDNLNNLNDAVEKEGQLAIQMSNLYKSLSGLPYSSLLGIDYTYLDFSSGDVINNIDPERFHTMQIVDITDTVIENQYFAVVTYKSIKYRLGFTVVQTDKGWMIMSISAARNKIGKGEAVKVVN